MLVDDVGNTGGGARGTDDFELRVFGADGVEELGEAAFVAAGLTIEIILVADLDVLQREGRGMAVLGAACTPDGVRAAGHVLDLIERVLDVGLEVGSGLDALLVHGISGVDGEDGLHMQILAPLEELEQAHAVGRPVSPAVVHVAGPLGDVADGLLPIEAGLDGVALEVVAAGKAQEGGLEVRQKLHDVFAIAVRPVVEGGRKERDHAEPDGAFGGGGQHQAVFGGGSGVGAGGEHGFVLLPGSGEGGGVGGGVDRGTICAHQLERDGSFEVGAGLGIERGTVARGRSNGNSPEALVGDSGALLQAGLSDGEFEAGGDGVVERLRGIEGHGGGGSAFLHEGPMDGILGVLFKAAVADEFAVEAAIVGEVDLLGHHAVAQRDGRSGLCRVDLEDGRLGSGLCGEEAGSQEPGTKRRGCTRFHFHGIVWSVSPDRVHFKCGAYEIG